MLERREAKWCSRSLPHELDRDRRDGRSGTRLAAGAVLRVGGPLVAPALAEGGGVVARRLAVGVRARAAVGVVRAAGVDVAPREAALAGAREVRAVVGVAVGA